jgi:hypothetical protein
MRARSVLCPSQFVLLCACNRHAVCIQVDLAADLVSLCAPSRGVYGQ